MRAKAHLPNRQMLKTGGINLCKVTGPSLKGQQAGEKKKPNKVNKVLDLGSEQHLCKLKMGEADEANKDDFMTTSFRIPEGRGF